MQKVIVLGLTGSVGESARKVIEAKPELFSLVAFSYHNNFALAKEVQESFSVKYICCTGDLTIEQKNHWSKQGVILVAQMQELLDIEYDSILTAVVGATGVRPTLKAASQGKKIMLANKESLVMAGDFLMSQAREKKAEIIPVDSEHSSVYRLLKGESPESINKIILTASGGPLREFTAEQIRKVDKATVLKHPTWVMGQKITVDSAGMINKALEVIEAHHLFDYDFANLDAVIHPQSLVHAIIQFSDGSYSFHVSHPDMVYPVAYSLYHPNQPENIVKDSGLSTMPQFTFEAIDENKFRGFYLGLNAGKEGGSYPAVFNAANEVAVAHFLADHIDFYQISDYIDKALESNKQPAQSIDDLFEADAWARSFTEEQIKS